MNNNIYEKSITFSDSETENNSDSDSQNCKIDESLLEYFDDMGIDLRTTNYQTGTVKKIKKYIEEFYIPNKKIVYSFKWLTKDLNEFLDSINFNRAIFRRIKKQLNLPIPGVFGKGLCRDISYQKVYCEFYQRFIRDYPEFQDEIFSNEKMRKQKYKKTKLEK